MTPIISQTLALAPEDTLHRPKQLLHLDWLSFQGHLTDPSILSLGVDGYIIEKSETGTPLFEFLYYVKKSCGRPICSLQSVPRHKYQEPDSVAVKMDNALLYSQDYYTELIDFIRLFNIRRTNISRVDFCIDCQNIAYGISARDFAERLADSRFVKSGTREITVHKRSNIYIDPRSQNGELKFETDNLPSVNAVTIGSHGSMCQAQVYNKTLELKQHMAADGTYMKQYIYDQWKDAGLDVSKDVWRIELRLSSKADTLEYVDPSGEIKHRRILLSDLDPRVYDDSIRGAKFCVLKDTILQAFNRWFNVYSMENCELSKLKHLTRQHQVKVLSETSELSFVAHAEQSRSMTKYMKGVVNFITDLFQSAAAVIKDKPENGVIQAFVIKTFLEKLYKVCKTLNTANARALHRGENILTTDMHTILHKEFDAILQRFPYLRTLITVRPSMQVEVDCGDHTETMTQEEFEWITKFSSFTIKNK